MQEASYEGYKPGPSFAALLFALEMESPVPRIRLARKDWCEVATWEDVLNLVGEAQTAAEHSAAARAQDAMRNAELAVAQENAAVSSQAAIDAHVGFEAVVQQVNDALAELLQADVRTESAAVMRARAQMMKAMSPPARVGTATR